jgi:hypothetical protein
MIFFRFQGNSLWKIRDNQLNIEFISFRKGTALFFIEAAHENAGKTPTTFLFVKY